MINIKIYFLLSLVSFVACGGDADLSINDDSESTTLAGEPSEPIIDNQPIRGDSQVEPHATVLTHISSVNDDTTQSGEPNIENVQYNDTDGPVEELPNDDVNRAPLSLTGESSMPLNEDQSISDDDQDVVYEDKNVIMVHDNDGPKEELSNVDDNRLSGPSNSLNEELQSPTNLSEQEPVNANIQEHGFDTSELHSCRLNTPRRWSLSSHGIVLSECNNNGRTRQSAAYTVEGVPLKVEDDIIYIDGKGVQGVESMRSFVIIWHAGTLYVNAKPRPEFKGIRGSGTWTFF